MPYLIFMLFGDNIISDMHVVFINYFSCFARCFSFIYDAYNH